MEPAEPLTVSATPFVGPTQEGAMPQPRVQQILSEESRKEIFSALVDAQDQDMSVAQSRKLISERFGLTEKQLKQIEEEGLDQQWPPL
jgi:hypothetical protein